MKNKEISQRNLVHAAWQQGKGNCGRNFLHKSFFFFQILPSLKNHRKWSKIVLNKGRIGNYLAVQWLGFCTSTAEGTGSIPGWRAKMHTCCTVCPKQNKHTKRERINKSANTLQREKTSLPKKEFKNIVLTILNKL